MAETLNEKSLSETLAQNTSLGEVIWLNVGEQKIFSIYAPQKMKRARGAILLLHDLGSNAIWPDVITPLLSNLTLHGWTILSVQMPLIDRRDKETLSASLADINPRIKAGLEFLASKSESTIALMGHGYGALAAAAYLTENNSTSIIGFAAIGFPVLEKDDTKLSSLAVIPNIPCSILDIFGSLDDDSVINYAQQRAFVGKSSKSSYRQVRIAGADHYFRDQGNVLARYIAGWLKQAAIK